MNMTYVLCILASTLVVFATSVLAGNAPSATEEHKDCHIKYQQFPGHTMCLPRSPLARTVNMTDAWKEQIINSHNFRRATTDPPATNMMKIRWDDEMEEFAKRWAEACDFRTNLAHDHQRFIPGSMFVGQSMSSTTLDFQTAMDFWWLESKDYKFGEDYKEQLYNGPCGFMVGHYTQMVWAHSYLVGCSAVTCNNTQNVIVCNYGPAGNMLPFDNPYEEGPQCSKCKNCTEDGLCDCGDMNCHGGKLDPSTCTCDCMIDADQVVPDFYQQPDCKLNCSGTDFTYCGYDLFSDCHDNWTAKKCPHMCKVCPYGEEGYVHGAATEVTLDDTSNTGGTYGANGTLATNGTSSYNGTDAINGTYSTEGTPTTTMEIVPVTEQLP